MESSESPDSTEGDDVGDDDNNDNDVEELRFEETSFLISCSVSLINDIGIISDSGGVVTKDISMKSFSMLNTCWPGGWGWGDGVTEVETPDTGGGESEISVRWE